MFQPSLWSNEGALTAKPFFKVMVARKVTWGVAAAIGKVEQTHLLSGTPVLFRERNPEAETAENAQEQNRMPLVPLKYYP